MPDEQNRNASPDALTSEESRLLPTLRKGIQTAAGQNSVQKSAVSVIISAEEREHALRRWRALIRLLHADAERYGFDLSEIGRK